MHLFFYLPRASQKDAFVSLQQACTPRNCKVIRFYIWQGMKEASKDMGLAYHHWPYEVKQMMEIPTKGVEWDQYPLNDYPMLRPSFDNIGIFQIIGKKFVVDSEIEDH